MKTFYIFLSTVFIPCIESYANATDLEPIGNYTKNVSTPTETTSSIIQVTKLFQRVVEGYDCAPKERARLVSIISKGNLFCGASFIAKQWILTAAHCCERMHNTDQFVVKFGQREISEKGAAERSIKRIFMHTNFSMEPLTNDICLIQLKYELTPTDTIKLTRIASKADWKRLVDDKECKEATVMGFGEQAPKEVYRKPKEKKGRNKGVESAKEPKYNPKAQCAALKVVKFDACSDVYGDLITDTIFCGAGSSGVDACQGDSGGPLVCNGSQIGIVSAGYGCAMEGYPGLYNRVDTYTDFIDEVKKSSDVEWREPSGTQCRRLKYILLVFCLIIAFFET